jgi:putative hydrolase of the HAD superfamily
MKAIIFDFDGLIMDTETATFEAWREIYAEHGQPLTIETWAQCVGSDFGDYDPKRELEKLTGQTFDWDVINAERRERVMTILSTYDALPGVRDRLQEAEVHGIYRAVASSSPRWWVEHWLKHLGLLDAFQNITCLEDTGKVKPHPSLFQHAAAKLGSKPDDIVVLEDSLNGLRAARSAEMRCVVVPCAVTQHLDFDGAWRQFDSLEAFEFARLADPKAAGATS